MSDSLLFFYITVPHNDTGVSIAKELLNQKLIACGNVLPAHIAVYEWEGKINEESEHILILKTRKELAEKVEAEVLRLHPYECPCIAQIPIEKANPDFMDWLHQQTKI